MERPYTEQKLLDMDEITGESQVDAVDKRALAYGPIAPIACNDAETGKKINRRVEVWIRD